MSFNITDYILVFDNIVSDDLCNQILKEYEHSSDWLNTVTGGGLQREVRRCDNLNMTEDFIIQKNYQVRKYLDDEVFKCASVAIQKYNERFNKAQIQQDSGYTLLRYQEGEYYKEHTDHFLQVPRTVSCSFSLNDGYEGGEWGFFNREVVIKPPKGSAVMFPSNFMYPHEIMPVTKGVRYSIITWFI